MPRLRELAALVLAIWIALDFQGLFTAAFGTYFYFGLKGTNMHVSIMGLVSLISISGPLLYWVVFLRRDLRGEPRFLLVLQLTVYLLCAFVRQSDVFAWATVAGRLISGVAIVSVLRRLRDFPGFETPVLGIALAILLHIWARIANDGLPVAVRPTPALLAALGVLSLVALLPGRRAERTPSSLERAPASLQVAACGFVLVLELSLALLCNVNLWSAKTPEVHASAFVVSLALGCAFGLPSARFATTGPWRRGVALAASAAGIGFALLVVLELGYSIWPGLLAHFCGCAGLAVLCTLFVRRLRGVLVTRPRALPIGGLQVGAAMALGAIGLFLTEPATVFFWLAFGVGVVALGGAELARPSEALPRAPVHQALVACFVLLVTLPAIPYLARTQEPAGVAGDPAELTVMTTNARYGWTDDFRFDPEPYVLWLDQNPATILGMQEVNKGNFYGGYIDVFEFYRRRVPGRALYGDANFGFGNALFTDLEILEADVVDFERSDMIRRSSIRALVLYRGREIEILVTHLSHLPHPNEIRQAQVAELVARLERSERPWILMGDMNALPGEPEIVALARVAHPVFHERSDLLSEPTYPSARPELRLDYIFFSRHFDLVRQTILDTRGTTDHRAVRSVLTLAR